MASITNQSIPQTTQNPKEDFGHSAAELLVLAYEIGEVAGGSVDWEDLNRAYRAALAELGQSRVDQLKTLAEAMQ